MAETAEDNDKASFVAYRDKFHKIIGRDFKRLILTETNAHEGPVYVPREHALYYTTVPEPGPSNIAIMRLQLGGDRFPFTALSPQTVRQPSNMANGMTLDREGRLVICEQGTRGDPARISRMDLTTHALETVVDQWRGLRFNSPNDVVVRSDETIWFTDPNYGEIQGFKPTPDVGAFVYRHDPATGRIRVRYVDVSTEGYEVARKYMTRLEKRDLEDGELLERMAAEVQLSPERFVERFGYLTE